MIGAFPMKREDRWVFELVEALVNGGICQPVILDSTPGIMEKTLGTH